MGKEDAVDYFGVYQIRDKYLNCSLCLFKNTLEITNRSTQL